MKACNVALHTRSLFQLSRNYVRTQYRTTSRRESLPHAMRHQQANTHTNQHTELAKQKVWVNVSIYLFMCASKKKMQASKSASKQVSMPASQPSKPYGGAMSVPVWHYLETSLRYQTRAARPRGSVSSVPPWAWTRQSPASSTWLSRAGRWSCTVWHTVEYTVAAAHQHTVEYTVVATY